MCMRCTVKFPKRLFGTIVVAEHTPENDFFTEFSTGGVCISNGIALFTDQCRSGPLSDWSKIDIEISLIESKTYPLDISHCDITLI